MTAMLISIALAIVLYFLALYLGERQVAAGQESLAEALRHLGVGVTVVDLTHARQPEGQGGARGDGQGSRSGEGRSGRRGGGGQDQPHYLLILPDRILALRRENAANYREGRQREEFLVAAAARARAAAVWVERQLAAAEEERWQALPIHPVVALTRMEARGAEVDGVPFLNPEGIRPYLKEQLRPGSGMGEPAVERGQAGLRPGDAEPRTGAAGPFYPGREERPGDVSKGGSQNVPAPQAGLDRESRFQLAKYLYNLV